MNESPWDRHRPAPTGRPTAGDATRAASVRRLAVATAVVLALASGLVLKHLDGRYGPIGGGAFGGPVSERGLALSPDGFDYRLASEPGTTATFFAALDNQGPHRVRIQSIRPPHDVSDVRWSVYRVVPGGDIAGVHTRWRSFPATIPAHGTIRVLLTVHRPACPADSQDSGVSYDGSLSVRWRSLLRTHRTTVKVLPPIRVC